MTGGKTGARVLEPPGWPRPRGYSNGIAARGTLVFVAGQVGWDTERRFAVGFVAQARKALENIVAVLAEADARPEHICRMTWYFADMALYKASLRELGEAYKAVIGAHYPAMTAIGVVRLDEPEALVEIEATAVVPDLDRVPGQGTRLPARLLARLAARRTGSYRTRPGAAALRRECRDPCPN